MSGESECKVNLSPQEVFYWMGEAEFFNLEFGRAAGTFNGKLKRAGITFDEPHEVEILRKHVLRAIEEINERGP